jgi:hypothetical protein
VPLEMLHVASEAVIEITIANQVAPLGADAKSDIAHWSASY